jgi:phosphoribosylglycinamide formyltransferase 1
MAFSSMPDKTIQQTPPRSWPQGQRRRLAVLISGRGSNLQALYHSAQLHGFALDWLVVANQKESQGLRWAKDHGLETELLLHSDFASREEFDRQLADRLNQFKPHLVVLAGFMRILTDVFFGAFHGPTINIHPSLLPAYSGLQTHARALQDGVAVHGATVHSVTPQVDHGPILAQAVLGVSHQDDEKRLGARVLEMEHKLLPMVTWALLRDDLQLIDGRWSLCRPQSDLPQGLQFSSCLFHPQLVVSPR